MCLIFNSFDFYLLCSIWNLSSPGNKILINSVEWHRFQRTRVFKFYKMSVLIHYNAIFKIILRYERNGYST